MRYVTGSQSNFYQENSMSFNIKEYSKEVAKLKRINTSFKDNCDKLSSAMFKPKSKKQKIRVSQLKAVYYRLYSNLKYQKKLIKNMNRRLDELGRIYPKRVSCNFVKLDLLELKIAAIESKNNNFNPMSHSEFINNKQELLYRHTGGRTRLETQLASYQDRKSRLNYMLERAEARDKKSFAGATIEELVAAQKFADKTIKIIEDKLKLVK